MLGWSISARAWRSASKRASDLAGVHAGLDDLERDRAADGLLLLGHVDGAHAALADLLQQLVGADDRARAFGVPVPGLVDRRADGVGAGRDGSRLRPAAAGLPPGGPGRRSD